MRPIDADAFDKCLEEAEDEAIHMQKYVFASALNTIRGNLRTFPAIEPEHKMGADNGCPFLMCKHGGFGDDACSKCRWAYRDMYEANEEGTQE